MAIAAIISALVLGLGGSLHCAGMCGPLVLSMPFHLNGKKWLVPSILLYNSGRIGAYMVLGILIYLFGEGMNWIGISQYISVSIGILLLVGVALPFIHKNLKFKFLNKAIGFQNRALGYFMQKKHPIWTIFTGFLNGLLPCGMVYVALAAGLAGMPYLSPVFFMFFFGLGNLPVLFFIAFSGQKFSPVIRKTFKKVTPVITVVLAVLLVIRGLNLGIPGISPKVEQHAHGTTVNCCVRK
ncbi:MAG: sulfite exporter TauE/SafE family protein [Bacteroidetes bacterium]|nr:sulfite exporter TauE/SafE family protein [Bacteroidota bacterium]